MLCLTNKKTTLLSFSRVCFKIYCFCMMTRSGVSLLNVSKLFQYDKMVESVLA